MRLKIGEHLGMADSLRWFQTTAQVVVGISIREGSASSGLVASTASLSSWI
jgi:hypothetical protein